MKLIKLTDTIKEKLKAEFDTQLLKHLGDTDTFKFSAKVDSLLTDNTEIEKPVVLFTPEVYTKLLCLAKGCDGREIGFHGTVNKANNIYLITDLLVYPQETTATTVTTDETELLAWQEELSNETFNSLRFQGHTHPTFSAQPSGTDLEMYSKFLRCLGSEDFYIFLIINKNLDIWLEMYDYKQNVIFESKDIVYDILGERECISDWLTTIKKQVKENKTHVQRVDDWYQKNGYQKTGQHNKQEADKWYDQLPGETYLEWIERIREEDDEPPYSFTPKAKPVSKDRRKKGRLGK